MAATITAMERYADRQAADNDKDLFPYAEGLERHADQQARRNRRRAFPYTKRGA